MGTSLEYIKTLLKLALGRGVRKSYGQFGEDAVVQSLLKNIKSGTYIDVGAYHPTLYSNTYALYKKGWSGVMIDPNAAMGPLFALIRGRDTFVCAAIGQSGSGTYYAFSDGAYNTFDADEARERGKLRWLKLIGQWEVPFKPLSDIVREEKVTKIDFLNIDVEGRDLEVLRSYDWSIKPQAIAIEDEHFDPADAAASPVFAFLRDKGYTLAGLAGLTCVYASNQKDSSGVVQ